MSLAKRALRGSIFVALNSYLSLFIYFVVGVILARLLSPADFGLYRLSLFFADLFGRLREFGLDKALIHKQDDLTRAFRTHFTLQFTLSLFSFLAALFLSPLLLRYYPPTVSIFLIALSFFYFFQALGSTQRIYLEKDLQFRTTALVDVVSLIASSLISIFMALKGFGVVSLVVGYGSNFFFSFILLWLIHPWKIRISQIFLFDKSQISWFMRFGSFLFLGGITTFVLYKYNDFILGTFLSTATLGFYARAFNYAQLPTSLITSVISKVALPTYSLVQKDHQKLSSTFSLVLGSIVRLSFPLSLLLFLIADDFILFLLGPKWLPMVPIFKILLVYGVLRSVFDDLGELFTAVGKPRIISTYLFVQAIISLFLSPILASLYQANGAAISLTIVLLIGALLAYFWVKKTAQLSIISVFLPTIIVCFLTLVSFDATLSVLHLNSLAVFPMLMVKVMIFTGFYSVFLMLIDGRSFLRDLRFILNHVR